MMVDQQTPPVDRETKPYKTEQLVEAKKFIRYSLSALDYDDAKASIENMQKALNILQKR